MIEFDRVSKRYGGGQDALANINFTLGKGEMAFLTGHSGAGKSTLLKLILAMEPLSGGRLTVAGLDMSRLPRRRIPPHRRRIGTVFQDHQLLFDRSVAANVALPLRVSGFPPQDIQRRVRAALDKVGLLGKEKLSPAQLSGGEQQRVGIARAVVGRPGIILADEPTGNLDPALSSEIMAVFRQFREIGVCLLIATHDTRLIQGGGCRVLTLDRGRLVSDQPAAT
ncbi:MAG: cell division ATP-binding protein FtsE [Pseudohongiellaceae bacterium]